jgi:hypothetical protein
MATPDVGLIVVVTGFDVVAAQTVHARKTYEHAGIQVRPALCRRRATLGRRPGEDRLLQVP